jgi:hypothetical protein
MAQRIADEFLPANKLILYQRPGAREQYFLFGHGGV